jgi:hypothetical protein
MLNNLSPTWLQAHDFNVRWLPIFAEFRKPDAKVWPKLERADPAPRDDHHV